MLKFDARCLFPVILSEAKDLLLQQFNDLEKQILRRCAPQNDIDVFFNLLLV